MHAADFGPVLNALSDLLRTFDMTTTDTGNGDRRVDSPAHARTLSEATDRAVQAMCALSQALPFKPVPAANVPPFIQLSSSDSPTAPGQPEAVGEVSVLRLGDGGTVPMVVAAHHTLTSVLGFPARRWNAMQARRPGANHPRWLALDVIPRHHLGEIRKAAALLHQVERALLAREASESGVAVIDPPPLREIDAMAKEAAARWASIEAIDDLLRERVRAAGAFIAKHPRADRDLAIGPDVDLEVVENGADVTGRTLSWSLGPGNTRFRGVLLQLYPIAHAEVLRYLESRASSDTSYRPACDGAALIDALRYLNDPTRVKQAWADMLRADARLRQYISSELGQGRGPGRKRRRRSRAPRELTPVELTTLKVVAECGGSIAEAARKLGRDRKTVRENYNRGSSKASRAGSTRDMSVRAKRLPLDDRGQEHVSEDRR